MLIGPAFAHDPTYGLMHCYSGKHCPQDTLVFGTVIKENDGFWLESYTLKVQKVLRGNEQAGKEIDLRKSGVYNFFIDKKRTPKTGDAIVVSYIKKNEKMPYTPHYIVWSKTTDWEKMEVLADWHSTDIPAVERFVRNGGTDDDFFWDHEKVYFRRKDGTRELIYTSPSSNMPSLKKVSNPSFSKQQSHIHKIVLAGIVVLCAFLGLLWMRHAIRKNM